MQKTKKGISLIVLVITILVMIILAATIIISLTNNGIIDKANDAVDKTNEKQVEELVNLAWADAYAENVGKSNEKLLQALKTSVEKALSDNNLNKEDYGMEVTTTGVTIVKGWLQKSNRTVVKGSTTLEIGDYVNYESGVETYKDEEGNEKGWQVLGAENGELLILSTSYVGGTDFEKEGLYCANDVYENGVSELNDKCEPYGKGAYATNARSITVEDVDRVTGYDKTTYNKGKISEYGNVVTYTYNGTYYPTYSGSNGVSGKLTISHGFVFQVYDIHNMMITVYASDLANEENIGKELAKVKNTSYGYAPSSETDLKEKAPNAYNMLCGASDEKNYWLASTCVCATSYTASYGLFSVDNVSDLSCVNR